MFQMVNLMTVRTVATIQMFKSKWIAPKSLNLLDFKFLAITICKNQFRKIKIWLRTNKHKRLLHTLIWFTRVVYHLLWKCKKQKVNNFWKLIICWLRNCLERVIKLFTHTSNCLIQMLSSNLFMFLFTPQLKRKVSR